jgi:TPR repeat protein
MQSSNFTNPMSLQSPATPGKFLRWLPAGLLAAAVAAAALLGAANRPGDELDWLSRLAHEGDSGAQLQLGLAYRDGRYGLNPDARTGFYWLDKAAEAGNAYAEDAVAVAYARGQGTEQDLQAARRWWQRSIARGNKTARLHLGEELLQEGRVSQAEHYLGQ